MIMIDTLEDVGNFGRSIQNWYIHVESIGATSIFDIANCIVIDSTTRESCIKITISIVLSK